jgi:hypothetical protein
MKSAGQWSSQARATVRAPVRSIATAQAAQASAAPRASPGRPWLSVSPPDRPTNSPSTSSLQSGPKAAMVSSAIEVRGARDLSASATAAWPAYIYRFRRTRQSATASASTGSASRKPKPRARWFHWLAIPKR